MKYSNQNSHNKVIFITGTPGTGKTSLANFLKEKFSDNYISKIIKISELAIQNDMIEGIDSDKGYKIVNISKLDKKINEEIENFMLNNLILDSSSNDINNIKSNNKKYFKLLIVEGHLSHLCNCKNVDKIIVLRLNPKILEKRLKSRSYSENKINENLEAEALGVCSAEAYQNYADHLNEIDTSDLSINEVASIVESIIFDEKSFPVGKIDFMDWFLF
ncbi:hypothetical protein SDC9_07589 [bioreactor metagenome]|uniref:Adenylate kinase n=1 Tax=bioreactor metagenome TaxID=1076179 RepID=A0A644T5F8_9ZZZZ|nr:adenylate kinase family protein [Methanobrevibacter sp.]MEA4957045.1 adenylate kinase family protein [Methanobrevibacter sp.]